jgi:F0F1-type ATP synthase membrane subunit b/b'
MGLWRYSMAAVIVLAAVIDVAWWIPAQQHAIEARQARVELQTPQCKKLRLEAQRRAVEIELQALEGKLDAIDAELMQLPRLLPPGRHPRIAVEAELVPAP